jgi:hypothetical protein
MCERKPGLPPAVLIALGVILGMYGMLFALWLILR